MTMEPSNLRKKNKGTTICDKRTVKCNIGTAQCDNGPVKCEKKLREPPNMRKELSNVILKLHNEYGTVKCEKKSKGTIKSEKRIVTCDVGTAQCVDRVIQCKKKK